MSNEKALREEVDRLAEQMRKLQECKEEQEHEAKKTLLETKTKLEFQTRRADDYEEKYKATLKYQDQEEALKEINEKLTAKENEVIKLLQADHEKVQDVAELSERAELLREEKENLESDLAQIKEAALSAIMDKDSTIGELTAKLDEFNDNEGMNQLRTLIMEMEEKEREMEERNEAHKIEAMSLIEEKEAEISELQDKLAAIGQKHEERVSRLEQQIIDYEKHIEEITALKDHEENYEEKYYHTEEKLRRTEKKALEFEQIAINERQELVAAIQKLQLEAETTKGNADELKQLRNKTKDYEKQLSSRKKELEQSKEKLEKASYDLNKKISHMESEKKILSDNLKTKQQELDKLKSEAQTKQLTPEPTLKKVKSNASLSSPQKREEDLFIVEKLKKQNKELEQVNQSLQKKLEEQTKELQDSRQKLLKARGADSSAEVNKLKVQMEDLTSYLKKVENDMLMKKITHAEDENFWSIKEKKYKTEIEGLNKKYKKQNSELLERIDRMKKLIPKDKKTDYYQSGFR